MSIINITKENFQSEVLEAKKPILVDFWAPWCGYCRRISPALDQIGEDREDSVQIGKILSLIHIYYEYITKIFKKY